jgi:VWFA-related protein
MRRKSPWVIGLLCVLCPALLSQTPAPQRQTTGNDQPFRVEVDVELVELPVSVLDRDGRVVAALTKENFEVLEDKVPQDISLFKHEDIPISIGLIIDSSGSMKPKRERVHSAALSFVRESNPDDETFVIAFDDQAWLQQDFTGSIGDLVDALEDLDPRLQTAMHDAIYLGVEHVKKGRLAKKVVLVISDGEDTASKLNYQKVLDYVRESKNVTLYAIGLFDENDTRSGGIFRKSPQKKASEALTELATVTGGRAFFPKTLDEVEAICRQIARELRNQYTLGYNPKNEKKDGTWREVKVNLVNMPRNVARPTATTKLGYFAPEGSSNRQN